MDPSIRTVGPFVNEDQRWLYGGKQDGPNLDIVLDRSAFDLVNDFPDGFLPSGIALGEDATTGMYIPYADADAGAGLLFASIPYDRNSTGDLSAALCRDATVIEALLPTGNGVDAGFKTDVPHLKFI